jgi:hypothetical protein
MACIGLQRPSRLGSSQQLAPPPATMPRHVLHAADPAPVAAWRARHAPLPLQNPGPSRRPLIIQAAASAAAVSPQPVPSPAHRLDGQPYWQTHLSSRPKLRDAVDECIDAMAAQGPAPIVADTAIVFVSSTYGSEYEALVELLNERVPGLRRVFGCTVGVFSKVHGHERLPGLLQPHDACFNGVACCHVAPACVWHLAIGRAVKNLRAWPVNNTALSLPTGGARLCA